MNRNEPVYARPVGTGWWMVRDTVTGHRFPLQLADPDRPPAGLEVLRDEPALDRNGRPRAAKPKVPITPTRKSSPSPKSLSVSRDTPRNGEKADQADTSISEAKEADQS